MSKRNDLAALSKKLPTSAEIEAILDELRESSDIAAAVTGAAIVEARLEAVIRSRFRSARADLPARIFENRGPLSDFNSKILVAEAFGYITGPMAQELQSVRAVRNAFAHAKHSLTFAHDVVERKVRTSPMLSAMEEQLPPVGGYPKALPSTKGAYVLVIRLMLIIFDTLEKHPSISLANDVLQSELEKGISLVKAAEEKGGLV